MKRAAQPKFCIGIKRTNGKVKTPLLIKRVCIQWKNLTFCCCYDGRMDAVGDIDLSHDGSQSSYSALYANAGLGLQLSLSHRLWPPVILLEWRHRQFPPSLSSIYKQNNPGRIELKLCYQFFLLLQVLFRMNLMTVVICLCMNRPYQSYYFVPLVSFWYLVVYIVLAVPPKVSAAICDANSFAYLYIIIKFCTLIGAITILYMSEVIDYSTRPKSFCCCIPFVVQVFFETIFLIRPWKALFVTSSDEIHEWWFRWSLDRYRSACIYRLPPSPIG
jgi:hypothetical protein